MSCDADSDHPAAWAARTAQACRLLENRGFRLRLLVADLARATIGKVTAIFSAWDIWCVLGFIAYDRDSVLQSSFPNQPP